MSKLSHIEDVEQRRARQASGANPVESEPKPEPQSAPAPQGEPTSVEEEEFHGLDSTQPMGVGHKTLIILASVVVAVTILYIVNSWTHFI